MNVAAIFAGNTGGFDAKGVAVFDQASDLQVFDEEDAAISMAVGVALPDNYTGCDVAKAFLVSPRSVSKWKRSCKLALFDVC